MIKFINETESNLNEIGLVKANTAKKAKRKKNKSDQLLLKEEFERKLIQGAAPTNFTHTKKVGNKSGLFFKKNMNKSFVEKNC